MSDTVGMKVLWLRPSTGENVSVRRERIAEHLEAMGADVTICDASGLDAFSAAKEAITGDYDIIAGNVRMGLYLGYPLARLLRKPFLGDVSDPIEQIDNLPDPLFRLLRGYEWFILERAQAVVFVYTSSYEEAIKRGIQGKKLPNAVDYATFADPSSSVVKTAKEELLDAGVDLERKVGIYTGTLTDRYSLAEIARAAKDTPTWQFVFIGDGKQRSKIESLAEEMNNVYYLGAYDYSLIPGFLQHADAGFCLIDAEQPLKLKEYGAAGLPAIVQPGELENLYDTDELIVVEPTSEEIARELERLAENDEMLETRGANLQRKVREYSWKDIAEEYYDLFREISRRDR